MGLAVQATAQPKPLLLTNADVLDMNGAKLVADQAITVVGGHHPSCAVPMNERREERTGARSSPEPLLEPGRTV